MEGGGGILRDLNPYLRKHTQRLEENHGKFRKSWSRTAIVFEPSTSRPLVRKGAEEKIRIILNFELNLVQVSQYLFCLKKGSLHRILNIDFQLPTFWNSVLSRRRDLLPKKY